MSAPFSIFNHLAQVDLSAVTDAQVEALTDEQRGVFFLAIEACKANDDAKARLTAAEKRVRAAMVAEDAAIDADNKANPPPSHIEALRAVIAANQPKR
jgi:aminoglycoside phosphotransferase